MTIEVDKPDTMIFEDVQAGPKEAAVRSVRSRATMAVKSAVQEYLKKFFTTNGKYRHQVEHIAPYVAQYETGISGTLKDDDSLHELQISRLWSRLKQQLPAFVIIDTSFKENSTGFSGVTNAYSMGDAQGVQAAMDATVGITIRIAAGDENTASDLRDTLTLIFGTLTKINRSYRIVSAEPQHSWEVRLPLIFEQEGVDQVTYNGESMDVYYTSAISLLVDFEGILLIPFENSNGLQTNQISQDVALIDPCDEEREMWDLSDNVFVPETVYLGQVSIIDTRYVPYKSYFVSDNPNILRVVDQYKLLPRKIGSCNVNLMGERNNLIKTYRIQVTS